MRRMWQVVAVVVEAVVAVAALAAVGVVVLVVLAFAASALALVVVAVAGASVAAGAVAAVVAVVVSVVAASSLVCVSAHETAILAVVVVAGVVGVVSALSLLGHPSPCPLSQRRWCLYHRFRCLPQARYELRKSRGMTLSSESSNTTAIGRYGNSSVFGLFPSIMAREKDSRERAPKRITDILTKATSHTSSSLKLQGSCLNTCPLQRHKVDTDRHTNNETHTRFK